MSETKLSGGNNDYYLVKVPNPKRLVAYEAECEDIIEALGMTFAEGCAFKAIWRSCAARTHGIVKPGASKDGIYDAEKVVYYGQRMVAQRKLEQVRFREQIVNVALPPVSARGIGEVVRNAMQAAGFPTPKEVKK